MGISIIKGVSIGKIKNFLIYLKRCQPNKKQSIIVNRERFIESVYHLHFYGNILNAINYTVGDFTTNFSENQIQKTGFSIQWNILIITQSLRDELNKFLFEYKSDDLYLKSRIKAFKNIITPALEGINNWSDIKDFRNNVLAHNGRDYFGTSVLLSSKFGNYNIPKYHQDFLILFQLLKFITKTAAEMFPEELQEAEKIKDDMPSKQKSVNHKIEDTLGKVNNIIAEMNKRALRYNATVK